MVGGRLLAALVLLAPLGLPGCDTLTGAGGAVEVRVEVDPTVVRTIHPYPVDAGSEQPREVTTLPLAEIGCLHTTPRGCRVEETIVATLRNVGSRAVRTVGCEHPLERWGLGSWHPVARIFCTLDYGSRPWIQPGRSEDVPVKVDRAPGGEYRVRFTLFADGDVRPSLAALSEPFAFQPLPDSPAFVCPTESRTELAGRIAQEALDSAWVGRPTHDVEELLVIENLVPGFGGLYLDQGRLTAWLQDLANTDELVEVVKATGRGTPVVRRGEFSFSELVGWKVAVARSGLFGILGVGALDADEARNRVTIRIANELIRADVGCLVQGIGMPEGMPRVVVE